MVPVLLLILAPMLLGAMIYGTTQVLLHRSDDDKTASKDSAVIDFKPTSSMPTLSITTTFVDVFSAVPTIPVTLTEIPAPIAVDDHDDDKKTLSSPKEKGEPEDDLLQREKEKDGSNSPVPDVARETVEPQESVKDDSEVLKKEPMVPEVEYLPKQDSPQELATADSEVLKKEPMVLDVESQPKQDSPQEPATADSEVLKKEPTMPDVESQPKQDPPQEPATADSEVLKKEPTMPDVESQPKQDPPQEPATADSEVLKKEPTVPDVESQPKQNSPPADREANNDSADDGQEEEEEGDEEYVEDDDDEDDEEYGKDDEVDKKEDGEGGNVKTSDGQKVLRTAKVDEKKHSSVVVESGEDGDSKDDDKEAVDQAEISAAVPGNKRRLLERRGHHHHRVVKRDQPTKDASLAPTGEDQLTSSREGSFEMRDVINIARKLDVPERIIEARLLGTAVAPNGVTHIAIDMPPVPRPGSQRSRECEEQEMKGGEGKKDADPIFNELQSLIDQLVDDHTTAMEMGLSQVVGDLVRSEEFEPFEDVVENIAVSRVEVMSKSEKEVEDQLQLLLSKGAGPKSVSRATLLTSVLNTLLPPIILQARADLRNLLIWLCSPASVTHIDGRDSKGDDTEARKALEIDARNLVHPDGSIDLKAIWDPRVGELALECLKTHWKTFTGELMTLVWRRFEQGKEFLVDELRGLIGLPKLSGSFLDTLPSQRQLMPDRQSKLEGEEAAGDSEEGHEAISVMKGQVPYTPQDTEATTPPRGLHYIQRNEGQSNVFVSWFFNSVLQGFRALLDSAKTALPDDTYNAIVSRVVDDRKESLAVGSSKLQTEGVSESDKRLEAKGQDGAAGKGAGDGVERNGGALCAWMQEKVSRALLG